MKLDLHVHTNYSACAITKPFILNKLIKKTGVQIALTDHNTMKGVDKVKGCIPGEEISTKQGHVIGLFLNERIKPWMSVEETSDKIKEQGGVVFVPHPYDSIRKNVKHMDFKKDVVEVFNGRVIIQKDNAKALEYAEKNKILQGVGSDAHTPYEFGKNYLEIENFNSVKEFLLNLKKAKHVINPHPYYAFVYTHGLSVLKNRLGLFLK
ncbi:PHP domain-containing protein [archaeon]|jgi:predicted metal-dependent phosphoesterase TrpH|nr:PHP domain-containing protein [archaeon]MBT4417306.1 PHP domain-containing protein [archaeon]